MRPRSERKQDVFLAIADDIGTLSTCDRASVGAVIVRDGRCISWGYNGAPAGSPHCSENNHGYSATEWQTQGYTNKEKHKWLNQQGCKNSTHAEANALAYAARQGISTDGGTLYVSISPCATCARLLIAAGINRVVAGRLYREPSEALNMLARAGVDWLIPGVGGVQSEVQEGPRPWSE